MTLYVAHEDAARANDELAAYDSENRERPPERDWLRPPLPRIEVALVYWAVLLFFFAAGRREAFSFDWIGAWGGSIRIDAQGRVVARRHGVVPAREWRASSRQSCLRHGLSDAPVASHWRRCRRTCNDQRWCVGKCSKCSCCIRRSTRRLAPPRQYLRASACSPHCGRRGASILQFRRFATGPRWLVAWRCWHFWVSVGRILTYLPMCWALHRVLPWVCCLQGGTAIGPLIAACSGSVPASLVRSWLPRGPLRHLLEAKDASNQLMHVFSLCLA